MKFHFSVPNPANHFIHITLSVQTNGKEELSLQLPAWRPGRYELGNFAKNIRCFSVSDNAGNILPFTKTAKDTWLVQTCQAAEIQVSYQYYAAELNAGSTFADKDILYVNPVNCCMYIPERMHEKCTLTLQIPENYQVASGLKKIAFNQLEAADFHTLADGPFIASPALKSHTYTIQDIPFTLWVYGHCSLHDEKIIQDFSAFTKAQLNAFGHFPASEYHFLFLFLPYKAYHGVEHGNSTVITLGPAYEILKPDGLYKELLGVSSHELYHTWNVKNIRPDDMWPYNYTRENYSRMGYLYEGATTYYGDLFLLRATCFTLNDYLLTFNKLLERHFSNTGRMYYSVAESSFDTWLDGYVKGIPGRKTSIYTEGALVTFMLDTLIRSHTNNRKSFDDVMRYFYTSYAREGKPVNEAIYKKCIEEIAGASMSDFFEKYIYGKESFEEPLAACLSYFGLELKKETSPLYHEAHYGFSIIELPEGTQVHEVIPGSGAEESGLACGDFIVAVNGIPLNRDMEKWCRHFEDNKLEFLIKKPLGYLQSISVQKGKENFSRYTACVTKQTLENENYLAWAKI